jgi:rare lipoprotein A
MLYLYNLIFLFFIFQITKAQNSYTDYTETGMISYYTEKFNDRVTASGEKFNNNELVASHKKLPFGTKVLVTNLTNKKEVIVKIVDRGPYAYGRIMDISESAAQQIGLIELGTTKANLKVISVGKINNPAVEVDKNYKLNTNNPTPTTDNKFAQAGVYSMWGTKTQPKGWTIQLGSFQNSNAAVKYCKKIQNDIPKEKIFIEVQKTNNNNSYKILLGEYDSEKNAENSFKKYKNFFNNSPIIRQHF